MKDDFQRNFLLLAAATENCFKKTSQCSMLNTRMDYRCDIRRFEGEM